MGRTRKNRIPTPLEYFERRIKRVKSGCWLWVGQLMPSGYGVFRHRDMKRDLAHRAAWILYKGPIGRLYVCHKCDTPSCANPDHLFLGTAADNAADAKAKGRLKNPNRGGNQRKTHCPQGHSYADAYRYIDRNGFNVRLCRTCAIERSRKARQSK